MDSTPFPTLTADLARVQQAIQPAADCGLEPSKALGHLMGGVPKLVRPTLTLMSASVFAGPGPASERVVRSAAAVELLHVGSMCHDDVMDEADSRRGRESVNARWGNIVAIVTGDYLLARGAELATELGLAEANLVAATLRTLCGGQLAEALSLYDVDRTEAAYLEAISGKTATLLSAACWIGALNGGGDPAQVDALRRFGLHFGIAFQVNDDVLDLVQTAERLGKPAGQDIAEGVYTLPTLRALARSPELRDLLGQQSRPIPADEVERARKLVVESGTLAACSAVADQHVALAVEAIESTGAPAPAVATMVDFARGMLNAVGIADPQEGASLFYPAAR